MESSGGAKRPADTDQTVDTYAFCQNCMRVSTTLQNCDKCGTQLTSENHIGCYGGEPKRLRSDKADSQSKDGDANGHEPTMNGNSSSPSATATNAPVPVPQALYVNRNAISTTESPSVRPQAIYVNVNNASSTSASSAPSSNSINTSADQTIAPSNQTGLNNGNSQTSTRDTVSSGRPLASSALSGVGSVDKNRVTMTSSSLGSSYSMQGQQLSAARTSVSSNFPPNTVAPSAPNPSAVSILPNMVSIPAQQIRIGAQKFKPLTSVQFKDDGILFTLKDYTYAPVLLNARAILKCKANLNLFQYPLFLLYLEGSCMKQIRNIFGLRDDEFSSDSPCEMKRCITILPSITKESLRDMLSRNLNVDQDLRNMFNMMEMRYERFNKILEEITPEDGCDILLSLLGSRTAPPQGNLGRTSGAVSTQSSTSTVSSIRTRSASNNLHLPRETNPAQGRRIAAPLRNVPPVAAAGDSNASVPAGNVQVPGRTPTLVIPSDPNRWREMQRSLVVGGVYHVQAHQSNTSTQYCLWNGTQLVPCRVQNAEVLLDCHQVWVGSLRLKGPTKVRIKADQSAGFYFTVTHKGRQHSIYIPQFSLTRCQVCKDNNLSAMFIDVTTMFADTLRTKFAMYPHTDPTFNPSAKEERRKRIVLFLKAINTDQWEALCSMQSSGRYSHTEIDIIRSLKILADCKSNVKVQQKITDWIGLKTPKPNLVVLENLARDLSQPEDTNNDNDDDDDDVIMTQEEIGVKCPYTQQVMRDPVRNKICGHNYEKAAIHDFILRKKGTAKCPYAGCGNQTPLNLADMESNLQLQDYIRKLK